LRSGVSLAAAAIDSGKAKATLSLLVDISNRPPAPVEVPAEAPASA
jgi:hypothetical protein